MSDDTFRSENPFTKLNKKNFPNAKIDKAAQREAAARAVKADIPDTFDADDDAALFLHAVGNIPVKINKKSDSGEKKSFGHSVGVPSNKHKKSSSGAVPAIAIKTDPDETFADLFEPAKKTKTSIDSGIVSTPISRTTSTSASNINADNGSTADDGFDMLFADAMKDVAPLEGKGRAIQPEPTPQPDPTVPKPDNPMQDFMDGKIEFTLSATDEYVEAHVLGLDLAIAAKLQQGQFSPEAHIDLHGLNSTQAFEMLIGFIRNAYMCGRRTVLVVPGRGKNSPTGIGVLREKLQEWFTQDPFRRVILAFCTAKPSDGGAGALYVLLRKHRKNSGKVYWDRRPMDPDIY